MTQHAPNPSTVTVPLGQAREAAGRAVDAAAMGLEGLQLLDGLLRAIRALDDTGPAAAIARAGATIAELYSGPLQSMHDDAEQLAAQLAALRAGAGGAA